MSTGNGYWARLLDKRYTRRRALVLTGGTAVGAALLAACGGSDSGQLLKSSSSREPGKVWFAKDNWKLEDETKEAVRGGIFRGNRDSDQSFHFDQLTLASSESPYAAHTAEHLMARRREPGFDPKSIEASVAIPALASAWEYSEDGRTIVFTMRPGVKFHNIPPVNGRVMDIDDWRTTDERFRATGQYRSEMPGVVEKSEFPDAKTMVWKLKEPSAAVQGLIFNNQWTYAIMPKELNENVTLARSQPIGTNYKMLDKYQPAITYEYKKHPDYWGGDPFIDRWHAPIIPEYANRYAQFIAGNIIDFSPTPRDVLRVAKDAPRAVIVANEINEEGTRWMQWGPLNPQNFVWKDPRVRQAMRQSINFKAIGELLSAKKELEAAGIPIELSPSTHVNQNLSFWLNPEEGELGDRSIIFTFDPADAKKRINAAGVQTPVEIPYFMPAEGDGAQVAESDTLVKDSIIGTGNWDLKITIKATDPEWRLVRANGQFDGFCAENGQTAEVDRHLSRLYHSLGNIERSPQAYPNSELDAMILGQRRELDPAKRIVLLKELQYFLANWMPMVPGRHQYTSLGFRWPWLHNIAYGNSGSPPTGRPIWGGHLQWLDKDMPSRDKAI